MTEYPKLHLLFGDRLPLDVAPRTAMRNHAWSYIILLISLQPVNIGNPAELTVCELAGLVVEQTGSMSEMVFLPSMVDDPAQRCPDISLAREALGWEPTVPLATGLARTIEWFRAKMAKPGGDRQPS